MSLAITNNVASLTAQHNLGRISSGLAKSLERLSSGLKINRGADGPAALVISEQQRSQIAGLQKAIENTEKGVSMVQTAEGALNEINSLLLKIRGLALDSANSAVNDDTSLAANQAEIDNALDTINRIANNTQFGNKKLLDGSLGVVDTRTDVANAKIESQYTTGLNDVVLADDDYHLKITTAKVDEVDSTVTDGLTVDAGATGDFFDDTSGAGGAAVNHDAVQTGSFFAGDGAFVVGDIIFQFDNTDTVQDAMDAINADANTKYTITLDNATSDFTITAVDGLGADGDGGKLTIVLGASAASTGATTGGVTEVHDAAGELVDSSGASLASPILLTAKALSDGTVLENAALGIEFDVVLADAKSTGDKGEVYDVTKTGSSATFQIGANAGQTASISVDNVAPTELATGVANGSGFTSLNDIDVTTAAGAEDTLALVSDAIDTISALRGTLGSFQQNTLESNANNLRATLENTTAAESVIRDTDFAVETANFTKSQVLLQVGTTVLANANQIPQVVLALLGR